MVDLAASSPPENQGLEELLESLVGERQTGRSGEVVLRGNPGVQLVLLFPIRCSKLYHPVTAD